MSFELIGLRPGDRRAKRLSAISREGGSCIRAAARTALMRSPSCPLGALFGPRAPHRRAQRPAKAKSVRSALKANHVVGLARLRVRYWQNEVAGTLHRFLGIQAPGRLETLRIFVTGRAPKFGGPGGAPRARTSSRPSAACGRSEPSGVREYGRGRAAGWQFGCVKPPCQRCSWQEEFWDSLSAFQRLPACNPLRPTIFLIRSR